PAALPISRGGEEGGLRHGSHRRPPVRGRVVAVDGVERRTDVLGEVVAADGVDVPAVRRRCRPEQRPWQGGEELPGAWRRWRWRWWREGVVPSSRLEGLNGEARLEVGVTSRGLMSRRQRKALRQTERRVTSSRGIGDEHG